MVLLISDQMIWVVSVLSFKDAIREQIPDVELFSMEYSISTVQELQSRFVCSKKLIWTDTDNAEIDGCESFEFNELLIYIKEIDIAPGLWKDLE